MIKRKNGYAVVRNYGKENQEVVGLFDTMTAALEETKWESSWGCDIIVTNEDESVPAPRMITCHCGEKHDLNDHGGDFDCDSCGQMFNAFGQRLKPRH